MLCVAQDEVYRLECAAKSAGQGVTQEEVYRLACAAEAAGQTGLAEWLYLAAHSLAGGLDSPTPVEDEDDMRDFIDQACSDLSRTCLSS